jgi:hypothetical protein
MEVDMAGILFDGADSNPAEPIGRQVSARPFRAAGAGTSR